MTCIVYMLTHTITGLRYVGWTSKKLGQRWDEHVRASKKPRSVLHHHMAQWDLRHWSQTILCTAKNPTEAKQLERHFIKEYNTNVRAGGVGLNMTDGGDGLAMYGADNPNFGIPRELNPKFGMKHTEETKQKMREARAKREPDSPETRARKSEAQRKRWARGKS